MPGLSDVLTIVRGRIQTYADKGIGEQNTKGTLINPVLRELGWDLEDLEEVRLEFKLRAMDNPVDYAFMVQRTPRLFVEAKSLGGNVADPKWAGQIMGYAAVAGVEWVVLTDGDSWHIYNSHVAVPVDQKLFRKTTISENVSEAAETLSLLSKDRMRDNLIDSLWKAHFVDRQLRTGLEKAFGFGTGPDAGLVRLIRKHAPQLTPGEIRAGLGRAQVRFDFPSGPVDVPGAPFTPPKTPKPDKPPAKPLRGSGTPWRNITLTDLIAAKFIRPPIDLTKRYRGEWVSARVEADGQVSFGGQRYTSLSIAAAMARVAVAGPFEGREYPQTNGWTFWQFRDEDGELREIDVLRQRLYPRR